MARSSWVGLTVLVTLSWTAQAQQYIITTVAGNGSNGYSGDGGLACAPKGLILSGGRTHSNN